MFYENTKFHLNGGFYKWLIPWLTWNYKMQSSSQCLQLHWQRCLVGFHHCYYSRDHCGHCVQGSLTRNEKRNVYFKKYSLVHLYKHQTKINKGKQKKYILWGKTVRCRYICIWTQPRFQVFKFWPQELELGALLVLRKWHLSSDQYVEHWQQLWKMGSHHDFTDEELVWRRNYQSPLARKRQSQGQDSCITPRCFTRLLKYNSLVYVKPVASPRHLCLSSVTGE